MYGTVRYEYFTKDSSFSFSNLVLLLALVEQPAVAISPTIVLVDYHVPYFKNTKYYYYS